MDIHTKEITPAPKPESTSHLRVLSNGAVYDMRKKRIVDSRGVTTKITAENAVEFQSRRQQLKRAAIARGANAVAQQGASVSGSEFSGDTAFLEAVGESMAMKALTPNDPKAVDAARFLVNETGYGDPKGDGGEPPADGSTNILVMMFNYIEQLSTPADAQIHEVIDAEIADNE